MPTIKHPCPGCKIVLIASPARRCPSCETAYNASRPSRRVKGRYDRTYLRLRPRVLERDEYTCHYCNMQNVNLVDHVLPVGAGGTNSMDNLVACCASCNRKRAMR